MSARPWIVSALVALLPACFPRVDWVDSGEARDSDGDGFFDHEDCDPDDPGVHPGAAEFCNGVDDDCDGLVDDEDGIVLGATRWAPDGDGDGYGSPSESVEACEGPSGYVDNAWDCDDTDPEVNPAATEVCDGIDNDCDHSVDLGAVDGTTWYADDDGDGYGQDALAQVLCEAPSGFAEVGGDCDDGDAGVHPGAEEVCDSVDEDCDGEVDEDVTAVFYRDRDGDGWGDPEVYVEQCPAPSGYVAHGEDCDDDAADVHPGADELCDGLDHDCDGVALEASSLDAATWYADTDGDGYGDVTATATACEQPTGHTAAGADCDDTDPAVNPDAYDLCGVYADGIDDDCDGVADDPAGAWDFHADADGDGYGAADLLYTGCEPPAGAVTDASDCDDSVAAAHPGGIERYAWGIDYDCDGDLLHSDADAQALLQGVTAYDSAGAALAAGVDLDGDGQPDLAIGAPGYDGGGSGAGAVHVLLGAGGLPAGATSLGDADVILLGAAGGDAAGSSLAALGDIDGDGLGDLAVGAPYDDGSGASAGAVYLATGAWIDSGPASLLLSDVPAILFGEVAGDEAGALVAAAGDTNGDGAADVLVGASSRSSGAGAVYLVEGPFAAETDLSLASAELYGEDAGDGAGPAVGGADFDGDGVLDLAIGAPGGEALDVDSGRVYILSGPVSGALGLASADLVLDGELAYSAAGTSLSLAGDADGDGLDDLLIGAPGEVTGAGSWTAGAAYLVLGSLLAEHRGEWLDLGVAYATFEAEDSDDKAAWGVASGGDLDGDGAADFLVGAPYDDAGAANAGALYLHLGPAEGTETLATAWIKITSTAGAGYLAREVAFAGDLDGDGLDDFIAGSTGDSAVGISSGAAWLFLAGDL
ncbi:MAG: MopE-related protein [Pseudomonadota bacterium]